MFVDYVKKILTSTSSIIHPFSPILTYFSNISANLSFSFSLSPSFSCRVGPPSLDYICPFCHAWLREFFPQYDELKNTHDNRQDIISMLTFAFSWRWSTDVLMRQSVPVLKMFFHCVPLVFADHNWSLITTRAIDSL